MGLLKPIIIFITGYFFINYFKENQKKIDNIALIGNDLKKLADKNKDYFLLVVLTLITLML